MRPLVIHIGRERSLRFDCLLWFQLRTQCVVGLVPIAANQLVVACHIGVWFRLCAGAHQIWEMKSCSRLHLIRAAFPETLKASAELAATQGNDGVCALYAPVHAGSLEPGTDDYFTAGLHMGFM